MGWKRRFVIVNVSGLFIYPVKSCAGIALDEARVTPTGFEHDRRWMVVGDDGRFLSQRQHPQLALVRVKLEARSLWLEAPNLQTLEIPLEESSRPTRRVTIWKDDCDAVDEGRPAAEFFSKHLQIGARLVRLAGDHARPLGSSTAQPGDRVSFADAYPFLLLSEASLDGLNRRLSLPLPMNRFRPNIVVSGCSAHAEDGWGDVRIGEVDFRVVKPCSRCVITTTNQETGERAPEPLKTLAEYRLVDGEVVFGQNLIHVGRGSTRLGDQVVVLAGRR